MIKIDDNLTADDIGLRSSLATKYLLRKTRKLIIIVSSIYGFLWLFILTGLIIMNASHNVAWEKYEIGVTILFGFIGFIPFLVYLIEKGKTQTSTKYAISSLLGLLSKDLIGYVFEDNTFNVLIAHQKNKKTFSYQQLVLNFIEIVNGRYFFIFISKAQKRRRFVFVADITGSYKELMVFLISKIRIYDKDGRRIDLITNTIS
jgi:hypothetical protein